MNDSNYLVWKQVLTTIRGYGLEGFLTGEFTSLEQYVTNDQSQTINPEFVVWQWQDQLLASWILSLLSEGILVMMLGLNSSYEIWQTLETNFASQSKARLMQYKLQLQTLKKGGQTMREYLNMVKSCCGTLALQGKG